MIVLPETLTETQNKFLLYYALQGLDFALEKADVKLSTLRGWLKKDSFKNLMEEIQTSYLSLAALELKKLSFDIVRRLAELVEDRSEKFDRERGMFLLKALDVVRTFTVATDLNALVKRLEDRNKDESRFEGIDFDVKELR